MLATVRFNGAILVINIPPTPPTLDKSEFLPFGEVQQHFHTLAAKCAGRIDFDVVCVFTIAKSSTVDGQEKLDMLPFPFASVDAVFADIQLIELHADYRGVIEQAYRKKTSGIIV